MHIVLLSGGSGKRLWPLSDAVQVKQFLPFLKDEQGQDESMLQRVYRQVKEAVPSFDCMIATSQSQIDNIRAQLPDTEIPVSVEPALKDTFWAAVLSAAYLRDVLHKDEEEAMMLFPVDPFVDASFFATAKEMDSILQTGQVNVGIVGITPTSPSEKIRIHFPAG
ncbi:MAG: hypothetical protein J6D18_01575 [Erysipelotrichaceae bacterium]|nr:hypothetical protein [Erysipelotrichaceae bacterium]